MFVERRISADTPTAEPSEATMYIVTVTINATDTAKQATYRTRTEALNAANALRSTLVPRSGGRITVSDPEGRELQTWIEHDQGAHFTQPGGFRT